jgi:hypothetical protein
MVSEVAEQQEGRSAREPHVLPIATIQAVLEQTKHEKAQESHDIPATPEPDVHDRHFSIIEDSGFRVSPVTSHDEPQEHTLNAAAKQPIVEITDRISEQHAGPSAPSPQHFLSRWLPSLLEMKQQLEHCVEDRLQRVSPLDLVRNLGHSLK